MAKEVYLLSLVGDLGKDRRYELYEDKTIFEKAYDFNNGELESSDEYYEKFVNEEDEVAPIKSTWSCKELIEYVNENDINIIDELEGYIL